MPVVELNLKFGKGTLRKEKWELEISKEKVGRWNRKSAIDWLIFIYLAFPGKRERERKYLPIYLD